MYVTSKAQEIKRDSSDSFKLKCSCIPKEVIHRVKTHSIEQAKIFASPNQKRDNISLFLNIHDGLVSGTPENVKSMEAEDSYLIAFFSYSSYLVAYAHPFKYLNPI